MTRNIFDREKREARYQHLVRLCAWSCFLTLALLALDRVGALALFY